MHTFLCVKHRMTASSNTHFNKLVHNDDNHAYKHTHINIYISIIVMSLQISCLTPPQIFMRKLCTHKIFSPLCSWNCDMKIEKQSGALILLHTQRISLVICVFASKQIFLTYRMLVHSLAANFLQLCLLLVVYFYRICISIPCSL